MRVIRRWIGNHFIECDRDSNGDLWIVIHSGSRHLGLEIAKHYQKLAIKQTRNAPKEAVRKVAEEMKKQGKQREIADTIKDMNSENRGVPKEMCWCEGELMQQYIHDMEIAQEFASMSRRIMADEILNGLCLHKADSFETVHNYLDIKNMILRKGAVSAAKGERLIIPMNMRDGSLICIGKGNDEWNQSAPHGAGRIMSRSEAKAGISLDEYKASMSGIYTTSVSTATLDESPMAYKPMQSILDAIKDTADVIDIIKPVYNFKAEE